MSESASRLESVRTKRKSLGDYAPVAGDAIIEEIRRVALSMRGLRVLHVNSAARGGGVAELLNSVVPLENDCGLDVEWRLLCPDEPLFEVTKGLHNALQGQAWPSFGRAHQETYLQHSQHCAAMINLEDYDVVIVHDPQPAAIRHFVQHRAERWVWRCHIDIGQPDSGVWEFLEPFLTLYDAAVFTMEGFVPSGGKWPRLAFIPPAIDPLSPKNRRLPKNLCREEVAEFGIDLARPLIIQVSRFDPWKDPLGVIEAFNLARGQVPGLQLAMVGVLAEDDPQGWEIYEKVRGAAAQDGDIHLLTNLNGVGAHEVNAFQRVADVVVQKSIREGFGLVVSEAVWKETPVVAGNTGGIPLQIQNGVGGFLVNTVEECAERVVYLLTHPDAAKRIATLGVERVRERFLTPRLLLDELRLLRDLTSAASGASPQSPA